MEILHCLYLPGRTKDMESTQLLREMYTRNISWGGGGGEGGLCLFTFKCRLSRNPVSHRPVQSCTVIDLALECYPAVRLLQNCKRL